MSRRPLPAFVFAIALAFSPGSLLADDFSLERLRAGEEAFRAKRIPEAIDQLRIACFGLLDQVEPLSECLVNLTLAQEAANRPADVQATLGRFLEVERRFAPYAKASVSAQPRRDFEAILLARVPQETLLSIRSLASLIETEEQKIAKLPSAERFKALEDAARREPTAAKWHVALARESSRIGDDRGAIRHATRALELDAKSSEARGIRAHAHVAARQFREALDDFAKLPGEAWKSRPDLYADLFVCQAETKDWSGAEGSAPKIPQALLNRPDVEKAMRDLAAERSRRPSS